LLANDLCRQAARTGHIALRTDGRQRRDFIALSEACRALLHLARVPSVRNEDPLYNVGSGWAPTVLDFARLIAARAQVVLRVAPTISTGPATDAAGVMELSYSTERLQRSGFVHDPAARDREIDQLLRVSAQLPAAAT
jgi:UDP-glucose 4-epimerase